MSIMRFDPFRDLDRLGQLLTQQGNAARQFAMPMDAYRDGDRFVIHFDVPGVPLDAIDLTVEKNVLTVRTERTWEASDSQEVLVIERPQGTFTRRLFLGDTLDAEKLQASCSEGVLTVTIPVAGQAQARKIEVSAGEPADSRTIDAGSADR